jgi:hypothetical protein
MTRIPLQTINMPDRTDSWGHSREMFCRALGIWATLLLCSAGLLFAAVLAGNVQ